MLCICVDMPDILSTYQSTKDLPASLRRIAAETCGNRLLYLSRSCISISPVMTLSIVLVTSKRALSYALEKPQPNRCNQTVFEVLISSSGLQTNSFLYGLESHVMDEL